MHQNNCSLKSSDKLEVTENILNLFSTDVFKTSKESEVSNKIMVGREDIATKNAVPSKCGNSNEPLVWGNLNLSDLEQIATDAYEETVTWQEKHISGSQWCIIAECTHLITLWNDYNPISNVSQKLLMITPSLLQQKPSRNKNRMIMPILYTSDYNNGMMEN